MRRGSNLFNLSDRMESKKRLKRLKISIYRQDVKVPARGNRADEKIRVCTLNTFASTHVEERGSQLVVVTVQLEIGKSPGGAP